MKTIFDTVALQKPKRSKFDLSHEKKATIPFGALIPTMAMEVLPGDSFKVDTNTFARFQSMLSPVMHRVDLYTHYFYVRNAIVTRQWTRFISYQGNRPRQSTFQSILPYFTLQAAKAQGVNGGAGNALKDGSLLDYLGFPTAPNDVTFAADGFDQLRMSALLPLAYQRIWNDFYRDPNFTQPMFSEDSTTGVDPDSSLTLDSITGNIAAQLIPDPEQSSPLLTTTALNALLTLRWRSWEKDYLTTAQPHAQLGNSDVRIPITIPNGSLGNTPPVGTPGPLANMTIGKTGGIQYPGSANNASDNGSFTVSALRVARALKIWLENSYRGGTRYAEQLWNHWMVSSDDQTIGQAQYLGGAMQPIVISEVVTTAPATPTQPNIPAASLVGHGITYSSQAGFTKKFKEHGFVMAVTSVIPRTGYLYSLPRAFMRTEPLDFAFPEFAQLGEQPVLGSEVMFKLGTVAASPSAPNYTGGTVTALSLGLTDRYAMGFVAPAPYLGFNLQNDQAEANTAGWGFQGRYADYKYQQDTVHGLFRNSQSFWHLGRMLTPDIALNHAFVTANPRMDIFAVLPNNGGTGQFNQHPINLQVFNRVSVIRSLPYYNQPMR